MSDSDQIERRVLAGRLELRKAGADSPPRLVGYAAKFGVRSEDLGGWVEVLAPGAFDRALREKHDVRALLNHMDSLLLGRTVAGTLRLSVDQVGLLMEVDLPETSIARDLAVSVERGDIDQCSFQFSTEPGGTMWDLDSTPAVRTVSEVARLYDVSVVTFPAYPQTDVALRSLAEARQAAAPPPAPVERLRRSAEWHERAKDIE